MGVRLKHTFIAGYGYQKLNIHEPMELIIEDNKARIIELLTEDGTNDVGTLEDVSVKSIFFLIKFILFITYQYLDLLLL